MTVKELKDIIESLDDDAEVVVDKINKEEEVIEPLHTLKAEKVKRDSYILNNGVDFIKDKTSDILYITVISYNKTQETKK